MFTKASMSAYVIGLLVHLLCASPGYAWETDVHYGLTRWLALQAGFTPSEAQEIANGDQSVDDDWATSPVFSGVKIILFGDPWAREASESLRFNHFASAGLIPGEPTLRKVDPGSTPARKRVEAQLAIPIGAKPYTALKDLGKAFHVFQDSWAHQGEPDVPLGDKFEISRILAWAHPEERGGWSSHEADHTYRHTEDTRCMAKETYEYLRQYRQTHPSAQKAASQREWSSIEVDVRKFANSRTKKDKFRWFKDQGFLDEYALRGSESLTIPGPSPRRREKPQAKSTSPQSAIEGRCKLEECKEPSAFTDTFLNTWIVEKNISILTPSLQMTEIQKGLQSFGVMDKSDSALQSKDMQSQTQQWTEGFLRLCLLDDHSVAEDVSHGFTPEGSQKLMNKGWLEIRDVKEKETQFSSLSDAIEWNDSGPYQMFPLTKDNPLASASSSYAVVFRFHHIPRDAVMLVITPYEHNEWKVTRLLSLTPG